MNDLSVWTWDYPTRYYLLHPWRWIKEFHINRRNARNRARKGYCYLDWANFDWWFCKLVPNMLRDMADKGHGYPGRDQFDTPEKWHEWLHKIADEIEKCDDKYLEQQNQYSEEFMERCEKRRRRVDDEFGLRTVFELSEEDKEFNKKYFARWEELNNKRDERIKQVMTELGEHWSCLWD